MSPLLRFVVAFMVFAVAGNVVSVALVVATGQSLGLPRLLHLVFSSLVMGGAYMADSALGEAWRPY